MTAVGWQKTVSRQAVERHKMAVESQYDRSNIWQVSWLRFGGSLADIAFVFLERASWRHYERLHRGLEKIMVLKLRLGENAVTLGECARRAPVELRCYTGRGSPFSRMAVGWQ